MKLKESPSTSDAVSTRLMAVSSGVMTTCGSATGASFTGLIISDMVAGAESSHPSLAMNWNESFPL